MQDKIIEEYDEPLGDLLEIPLTKGDPSLIVWIGSNIGKVINEWLTNLLQENSDVFA